MAICFDGMEGSEVFPRRQKSDWIGMRRKRAGLGGEHVECRQSWLKRQRNKGIGTKAKGEFWFGFWCFVF